MAICNMIAKQSCYNDLIQSRERPYGYLEHDCEEIML